MEKEYLERESLRQAMQMVYGDTTCPMHIAAEVDQYICTHPASDVVKVVRCKQCKHRGKLYRSHLCDHPEALLSRVTDNDYCSHGEEESSNE